jgi:hypothetical protein
MRKRLLIAVALVSVGLSAGQAHAVLLGFTGSLAVKISALDPVEIAGSGTATINGSGSAGHLTQLFIPAAAFATAGFVLPVTDPVAYPIAGVQVSASNGAGNFAATTGGGFSGIMPVLGLAKACLLGACSSAVANLTVPLSVVGVGGFATAVGLANVTVVGAPWTVKTATVGASTLMGSASPISNTGAPSGNLTLVTPIFISTNIPGQVLSAFAILTLHFVPEPGTLLLLGSGMLGLVAFGRSKLRD